MEKPAKLKSDPEYLSAMLTMQDTNEEQCTQPAPFPFLSNLLLRSHEAPGRQVRAVCTYLDQSLFLLILYYCRKLPPRHSRRPFPLCNL